MDGSIAFTDFLVRFFPALEVCPKHTHELLTRPPWPDPGSSLPPATSLPRSPRTSSLQYAVTSDLQDRPGSFTVSGLPHYFPGRLSGQNACLGLALPLISCLFGHVSTSGARLLHLMTFKAHLFEE